MHLIGYWLASLKDLQFCHPREVAGDLAPEVRKRLADYLDGGDFWNGYLGYSWCRFNCGIPNNAMGSTELTDGHWVWPAGLSHYVRVHNITLPDEFIAHVLTHDPPHNRIGQPRSENFGPLAHGTKERPSLDFWRAWCAHKRSPAVLERLRLAQAQEAAEEERRASEELARQVAQLVAERGLSDERCLWEGCTEKALAGMRICAKHSVTGHRDSLK
jgi:hypothetical protein